jgi:hypothetical protein
MEAHAGRGWGAETANMLRGAADAMIELETHPNLVHIYKITARKEYEDKLISKSKNLLVQDLYQFDFATLIRLKPNDLDDKLRWD